MQTVTLNDRVKIPAGVIFQKVGEEIVFLNLDTGIYFGLDPIGSRIWDLLVEKETLQAVFESMKEEYEVAPEELRKDILLLVQELQAKRLVEITT